MESVSAVHSKAAGLPIDQGVEPLEKRNAQYQGLVHVHYPQVNMEANRVHYHVDVHEFGTWDRGSGWTGKSLARVQAMALELKIPCSFVRIKICAGSAVEKGSHDPGSESELHVE